MNRIYHLPNEVYIAYHLSKQEPHNAVRFGIDVQSSLIQADWPTPVLHWSGCREERSIKGALLWRGMRVRMGAHIGLPTAAVDPVTGRMDYLGNCRMIVEITIIIVIDVKR